MRMVGQVKEPAPLATEEAVSHKGASSRRVCFVCTGNTCRSPMAQAVANALAEGEREAFPHALRPLLTPSIQAYSAGLYAVEGEPIAQNAIRALEKANVTVVAACDYHLHTAHTLKAQEAESYDLLVAMTEGHAMQLLMRFPQCAPKIVCMPASISDPYGGDEETYRRCLEEITRGVKVLLFAGGEQ